jgi:hypothetical protein
MILCNYERENMRPNQKMFKCKRPVITLNKSQQKRFNQGKSFEVEFPVSYQYNGGIHIGDEFYKGYSVPPPVVPEGWKLVNTCAGLDLNARPPYATMLLSKKS